MRKCIYCTETKPVADFSLEHVIPQCLGGSLVPDYLKTSFVCKKCNNDLGLFVDASFEKSWFVSHQLNRNARTLYDPKSPIGLPLICMGICDLEVPEMAPDEICESWLGPFGEQVYWIRQHDERLYWYNGGNPRTTKSVHSRAYFIFSIKSEKNLPLVFLSFRDSFQKRRIKKILCSTLVGGNATDIGFSLPDELDIKRINFFLQLARNQKTIKMAHYINFDFRFMAKLAIGISHCLFKNENVSSEYGVELLRALWHKEGADLPVLHGRTTFGQKADPIFNNLTGVNGGIVIMIYSFADATVLNLNIGGNLNWTIKIAQHENPPVGNSNIVLLIFKELNKCITMSFVDFMRFKTGNYKNHELEKILSATNKPISNQLEF